MSISSVRTRWLDEHQRLTLEAEKIRESQTVSFGLLEFYDALSREERTAVHQLLGDWLLSDDNKLRYDAEFIISQRRVIELASNIQQAINRCNSIVGPEAHYEQKKLMRILHDLATTN